MTSAELKHRVKLQEWAARIQDCRSSGLSVRAWCRQEEINAATYYRWERELLALAETEPCSSVPAVRFAELPAPKQVSRNAAERPATLHIGNVSLDIYPGRASSSSSLNWIHLPTHCSCSAGGGETGSRACTGKRTASSCCTSDWNRAREYSARDCAPRPLKLSIHSGGIEHPCRRR